MASSTRTIPSHSNSKNPFLNPPVSNNPFLRRISDTNANYNAGASDDNHVPIPDISTQTAPPVSERDGPESPPDSPEQAVPTLPERRRSSLPIQSATRVTPTSSAPSPLTQFDTSAYVLSSQEEDLEAAIQASLREGYAPPPGPPPPLPARPSANRSGTGALNSNSSAAPVPSAQHTSTSNSNSNSNTAMTTPSRGRLDTSSIPFARSRSESISPPPYTPQPNVRAGEVTMEAGPNRPFQNPPRIRQQPTGSNRWVSPSGPPPPGRLGYPQQRQRSNSNPDSLYIPPGGMPSSSSSSRTAGSSVRRSGPPGSTDESPCDVPTPGRPLLYDGNVLVYPRGFSCDKCHNTGYKSFDPSHPCRKCWQRYGKQYSGPLMYAPWSNRPADSNYQQPLPQTRGPLGGLGTNRPSNYLQSSGSTSRSSGGGLLGELYRSGTSGARSPMGMAVDSRPPPGSLIVNPGDPRIGGRRCWNCGGDGWISLFLFDRETCPTCN
ncbi:hypothetical protein FRB98_002054, partial [Tulasnella sp. 332]